MQINVIFPEKEKTLDERYIFSRNVAEATLVSVLSQKKESIGGPLSNKASVILVFSTADAQNPD